MIYFGIDRRRASFLVQFLSDDVSEPGLVFLSLPSLLLLVFAANIGDNEQYRLSYGSGDDGIKQGHSEQ